MVHIDDIIRKAEELKSETLTGSITPERLGEIICDTLGYLKIMRGMHTPSFDLLTSRTRRVVIEEQNCKLRDYFPMVRLKGEELPEGCIIELYRYQNRGNKKYKKVLSASLYECEAPEKWTGGSYRSLVLPWSLQRIFWETWDPNINGIKSFHKKQYDSKIVSGKWIEVGVTGNEVAKFNNDSGKPRESGPLFTASFGLRLIYAGTGTGGDMKTFRIALLRDISSASNDLRFMMKLDRGATVTTH